MDSLGKNRGWLAALVLLALLAGACSSSSGGLEIIERQEKAGTQATNRLRVGLALGVFGLGDQSFNDMQYSGLVQAHASLPISACFRVPASNDEKDLESLFLKLIRDDRCRLIIVAEAYAMGGVVTRLARSHPEVFFVLMESAAVALSNVAATEFAQNEGSYLAGMLAGRVSKSGRIGFIGGVDILPVKDFLVGFEAGVRRVRPAARVEASFVSLVPDFSGFSNPKKGHAMATAQYASGVDVIYAVAGGTGIGVIQAAGESKKFAIGVDSNQDHLAPGHVLTSMMKRADVAVTNVIGLHLAGKLRGGRVYRFDSGNYGVGLTDFEYTTDTVTEPLRREIAAAAGEISLGRIAVPSTLRQGK